MPCGWEGSRGSGVALATRYGLQWFIHLPADGLAKRDEHRADTPRRLCRVPTLCVLSMPPRVVTQRCTM